MFIHIAGTNGKGSVSTKIASALTQLGYKTGLFTSPHLVSFHERIQINGVPISEEAASTFPLRGDHFFERWMWLALDYFSQEKVDFAVIETGLGGTYDQTNFIQPILSVITSISFDHRSVLGNTLDEIAENKAGIIKPKTPVVISHRAALKPVLQKAFQESSPLHILPPVDDWMEENTALSKKAISLLFPIEGLDFSALPPCRFESCRIGPLHCLFDIAHNEDGLRRLFARLRAFYPDKPLHVIFGLSKDKDPICIDIVKAHATTIYYISTENPRLRPFPKRDLGEFLEQVNGLVVVTGSAYIMHQARQDLEKWSALLSC